MKRFLIAALCLVATPAIAQWQVPDHSVPVGRGSGISGFKSVGPCLAGVPIVGSGVSADPVCSTGGAFIGFANPTGAVGLSAVNGSATSAMRSDAAPALSGTIQSSLTGTNHGVLLGTGTFGLGATAVMTDGQLLVGQSAANPLPKTISGDVTVSAAGAVTIANNAVTNAKSAQMTAATLKGNPTGSTANATDFTIQGLASATLSPTNDYIPVYNAATGTILRTTPTAIASVGTLPTISDKQILANTSGGSAVPVGTSATTWFDSAYCNTAGYVIARLLGAWTCSQGLPINMVWVGADNTGATDSSAIIQSTVNANTAGNCLFFPAGSYQFTGITSSNPVCIYGVGMGSGPGVVATTYVTRFLNNSNTGHLFHITSYYGSIFRDFQVSALSGTPSAGNAIYLDSSGVTNQTRTLIQGVYFYNVYTAINILRPVFPTITGNAFLVWQNYAIIFTTSAGIEAGGGMISNNYFFGDYPTSSSTGPIYSEVGYTNIHNNAIIGGPYGVYFNIVGNPAGFIKVHDNTIENFHTTGVFVKTGDGSLASMVMIQNNEFSVYDKTPDNAIFIADSTITPAWVRSVVIQGNVMQDTTVAGGSYIWLGAGQNVIISGNVMTELGANSPYGIRVGGAVTNAGLIQPIQVLDNSFSGTFTAKYLVGASGIPVIRDLSSNLTVAQSIAVGAAAGSQFYATNATVPSSGPCTAGGTGSLLLIESGTSRCP